MIDSARGVAALAIAAVVATLAMSCGADDTVILATGTTPYDTGLLDALEPLFEETTGYELKVIAVGTGQALEMGRRGDADVVFAHDPDAEEVFVEEGYGVNRRLVMYNEFVIVGPPDDPIELGRAEDAVTAMHGILKSQSTFVSRADESGTHSLERELWRDLGFDPAGEDWYVQAGLGMGATLQIASQRRAYAISDRGTYLAIRDTLELDILFEGDPRLLNIYHVMQVNPERVGGVHSGGASAFVDFMVSGDVQALIQEFRVEEFGEPLFVPAAGQTVEDLNGPS